MPTVWDETLVPDGEPGEHLVMARRSGRNWFVGALTNSQARRLPLQLSFLGPGKWKVRLWKDAGDSGVNAEHLETEDREVAAGDSLVFDCAMSGGGVAWLRPAEASERINY